MDLAFRKKPELVKLLLENFNNEERLVTLFVSIDEKEQRWKDYVAKDIISTNSRHLLVSGGYYSDFASNYLVTTIPRYIIISKEGKFINADAPPPGLGLKELIVQALQP